MKILLKNEKQPTRVHWECTIGGINQKPRLQRSSKTGRKEQEK